MNLDTDLNAGDYMMFEFTGNWTLLTNTTRIIAGVLSSETYKPVWSTVVDSTGLSTKLKLSNFSMIQKSKQLTFFQPLVTPLADSTYTLTISAHRSHGGLAQSFSKDIVINKTTGYIR